MNPSLERLRWRKSSRSNGDNGNCVEVADDGDNTRVRDTKARHAGAIAFGNDAWRGFLSAVKRGEFS